MSQLRLYEYGIAANATALRATNRALCVKGVLETAGVFVEGTDRLSLRPIKCLMPDGTVVIENTNQLFQVELTSQAKNYTLTCRHSVVEVIGGVEATFELEEGLLPSENVTDGVVIAYLQYPGTGVNLSNVMLIQAPKQQLGGDPTEGDGDVRLVPFTGFIKTVTPEWAEYFTTSGGATATLANLPVEGASPTATIEVTDLTAGPAITTQVASTGLVTSAEKFHINVSTGLLTLHTSRAAHYIVVRYRSTLSVSSGVTTVDRFGLGTTYRLTNSNLSASTDALRFEFGARTHRPESFIIDWVPASGPSNNLTLTALGTDGRPVGFFSTSPSAPLVYSITLPDAQTVSVGDFSRRLVRIADGVFSSPERYVLQVTVRNNPSAFTDILAVRASQYALPF